MRIQSNGDILINRTTAEASGSSLQVIGTPAASFEIGVNGNNVVEFRNSGGASVIGSISINVGGTATAFNTSSDYRLKENVVDLDGAIDRLKQLRVRRFNFIADPDTVVDGFIAHEAATVVPEAITGTKDAVDADGNPVYQGIDQSKLVPLLTAALQDAIAEITTLKDRVAALEAA
jgi:Tol biopolymer transport system component